jgi:arsenate reductase
MFGMNKSRVLFLCTGNSCRSHMAEGWLRYLAGNGYEALSAGAKPAGYVHRLAIRAMAEVGVDISQHRSRSIDEFAGQTLDALITVCDNARESCPTFAGAKKMLHWSFEDPAQAAGNDEEKMDVFRRVRDEIRQRITDWLEEKGANGH